MRTPPPGRPCVLAGNRAPARCCLRGGASGWAPTNSSAGREGRTVKSSVQRGRRNGQRVGWGARGGGGARGAEFSYLSIIMEWGRVRKRWRRGLGGGGGARCRGAARRSASCATLWAGATVPGHRVVHMLASQRGRADELAEFVIVHTIDLAGPGGSTGERMAETVSRGEQEACACASWREPSAGRGGGRSAAPAGKEQRQHCASPLLLPHNSPSPPPPHKSASSLATAAAGGAGRAGGCGLGGVGRAGGAGRGWHAGRRHRQRHRVRRGQRVGGVHVEAGARGARVWRRGGDGEGRWSSEDAWWASGGKAAAPGCCCWRMRGTPETCAQHMCAAAGVQAAGPSHFGEPRTPTCGLQALLQQVCHSGAGDAKRGRR